MEKLAEYPKWYRWDGTLVPPGDSTDRGTVPDTPEMWELYRLAGGLEKRKSDRPEPPGSGSK